MRILVLIVLILTVCLRANAFSSQADSLFSKSTVLEGDSLDAAGSSPFYFEQTKIKPKHKKLKAVLLALFLGHFGVHRIYLGTAPNVPVVYSLTLGGGFGLLPVLDIVAILTVKDLERYSNNEKVFMWSTSK
jgi:TM2 domain-containing membrane protein YozV